MTQDPLSLAKSIDHTLLKPQSTAVQFDKLCKEAVEHSFMSVCIPPTWLKYCSEKLNGSDVKLCTVLGFPLGYHSAETKLKEAEIALADAADELDMVLNFSALINNDIETVKTELQKIRDISSGIIIKLILETCYLNEKQIVTACELAVSTGWDFVKTSTGFGSAGATVENVRLMKSVVGDKAQVKASGGIRDRAAAIQMIEAGATRLGTSAGIAILTGSKPTKGSY